MKCRKVCASIISNRFKKTESYSTSSYRNIPLMTTTSLVTWCISQLSTCWSWTSISIELNCLILLHRLPWSQFLTMISYCCLIIIDEPEKLNKEQLHLFSCYVHHLVVSEFISYLLLHIHRHTRILSVPLQMFQMTSRKMNKLNPCWE